MVPVANPAVGVSISQTLSDPLEMVVVKPVALGTLYCVILSSLAVTSPERYSVSKFREARPANPLELEYKYTWSLELKESSIGYWLLAVIVAPLRF